ncbi:MAG: uroporphyrinogen-III synthase [Mariprofundaceae bacterium]|nr:uroporphyrinogen-III synthase [Mariprofundaceae bacterium]
MMPSQGLQGCRILVTRSKQQYQATADLIEARGGIAIALPCLEIKYLPQNIHHALNQMKASTDVLLTSRNGVEALAQYSPVPLQTLLQQYRIAAVGKKTAQALQSHGIQPNIIPRIQSQRGLLEAYQSEGLPQSLMFFRAEQGSDLLSNHLQTQGVDVHTILAYRTMCPDADISPIIQQFTQKKIDAVLLGSAQTAQHYLQRIQNASLANTPVLVVISEQVALAADKLGLNVQLIAKQTSFASMLDALENHFSSWSCERLCPYLL